MQSRSRLEGRLADVARRRLTTVVVGPGLGKTTLLASWGRREDCAWYTLDSADRDPSVLARGIQDAARMWVPLLDPSAVAPSSSGEGWAISSEGRGRWLRTSWWASLPTPRRRPGARAGRRPGAHRR